MAIMFATPLFAQAPTPSPSAGKTFAFTDITVIPMDSERILPHTTVLVAEGRIVRVGASNEIVVPPNAAVIDGRGKFLMPGLADMHTHVDRAEMLPLFLASGVTTMLNMGLASAGFVTQTRYELAPAPSSS